MHDRGNSLNLDISSEYGHDPYRALWRAVLVQQIEDARRRETSGRAGAENRSAILWLRLANPDFRIVCELADLDPEAVSDRVRKAFGHDTRLPVISARIPYAPMVAYPRPPQPANPIAEAVSMSDSFRAVLLAEKQRLQREMALVEKLLGALDEGLKRIPKAPEASTPAAMLPVVKLSQPASEPSPIGRKRRSWSIEEKRQVVSLFDTSSARAVADQFGIKQGSVYGIVHQFRAQLARER